MVMKNKIVDKVHSLVKDMPAFNGIPGIYSFINEEIDGAVESFLPSNFKFSGPFTIDSLSQRFAEVNLKPRPGFEGKLSNQQISNNPAETEKFFEVTNADRLTIQTYNKMDKDPLLSLGKIVLSGMIGALRYSIKSKDPIVEAVTKAAYKGHHNDICSNIITVGRKLGFAFAEKTFKKQYVKLMINDDLGGEVLGYDGEITAINEIKFINPEQDITYWQDRKTDKLAYVEQNVSGTLVKVPRSKLIWASLDSEFGNIFGESSYRRAYPFWYYDKINYQLMFKHLERSGSPHLEARYPSGYQTTEDGEQIANDDIMKNIVLGLYSNGACFLPHEIDEKGNQKWTVEFKEAKNQSPEPYIKFKELSDSKKLQSIYIPEASLMNSNFSETDAKIDILMIIAEHLVNQIEHVIKRDVINQLVEYNFGPEFTELVDFNIDRTGLGRRSLLKEIYLASLRAGNNIKGYNVKNWLDFSAALEELGMPVAPFKQNFYLDENSAPKEDLEAIDQNIKDSNGENRVTPDNRARERESKAKNVADNNNNP